MGTNFSIRMPGRQIWIYCAVELSGGEKCVYNVNERTERCVCVYQCIRWVEAGVCLRADYSSSDHPAYFPTRCHCRPVNLNILSQYLKLMANRILFFFVLLHWKIMQAMVFFGCEQVFQTPCTGTKTTPTKFNAVKSIQFLQPSTLLRRNKLHSSGAVISPQNSGFPINSTRT